MTRWFRQTERRHRQQQVGPVHPQFRKKKGQGWRVTVRTHGIILWWHAEARDASFMKVYVYRDWTSQDSRCFQWVFYFSAGGLQGSCLFVKRLTDGATLVWRAGLQLRSRRLVNVSCPEVFRCFIGMTETLCFLLLWRLSSNNFFFFFFYESLFSEVFNLSSFPLPNGLWSTMFDVTSPDVVSIQPAVDTSEARKSRKQVVLAQENTNIHFFIEVRAEVALYSKKKVLI